MCKWMTIFATAACLCVVSAAPASGLGRIAIFADESHSISEVWYSEPMVQFDMYIFCLPSDNGLMCAEFSIGYPENLIIGPSTENPGLSVTLGDLDNGMSACFAECQNDWIWTHRQTLYLMDATPASIEIEAHSGTGAYQFANCEPGFPLEAVLYANPLYLNQTFDMDEIPPYIESAESINQNHVAVHFNEPLLAETALTDGDFTVFPLGDPGSPLDLIPSSLSDGDQTVNLVLLDTLVHNDMYTVRVSNVQDLSGNVMAYPQQANFFGLDTYPPEYTVCALDTNRLWVAVCFSEPVDPLQATYIHSYFFYEDPYAFVEFEVIEANLQPSGRTVQVVFDSKFKAGQSYSLWVRHVTDLAGNTVREDDRAFFMIPDTYPPEIIDITGVARDVLSVRFDEELDLETGLDPDNYRVLEYGDPGSIVAVTHVNTDVTPDWIYLFLARDIATDVEHVLWYNNLCDGIGNCIGSGGGPAGTSTFILEGAVGTMLENFSASYSNGGIEITWRLSTTARKDEFELLRAEDRTSFARLENPDIRLDGSEYRCIDETIEAGCTYRYRVEYMSAERSELLFETDPIRTPAASYSLSQNRPNPFNPVTEITYSLPEPEHVVIDIFDASGRRIKRLVDETRPAGAHRVVWNGLDERNDPVTCGIYLYRMQAGKWSQARKMVLIR